MSNPLSFQRNSFAHVAEATTYKLFIASNMGFTGAVAVGSAASLAAVFSRGRWMPSPRQFQYWARAMTLTGGMMVASSVTNIYAQEKVAAFNQRSKNEKA
jgi:hypothetical protein